VFYCGIVGRVTYEDALPENPGICGRVGDMLFSDYVVYKRVGMMRYHFSNYNLSN